MSTSISPLQLFAPTESRELATACAEHAPVHLAPLEDRSFDSGEFKLRPLESVRGQTVYVMQSLAGTQQNSAAERLVRLLFLLYGLQDAGARERVALIPYFAFARKERRTQPRDPVNSRYVAQMLEAAGVSRIITLDVHSPTAIDNAFRIPVDHLTAAPLLVDHFATCLPNKGVTVVSPDIGGVKRAQIFQELLEWRLGVEVELAFLEKRRAKGIVSSGKLVGAVAHRHVVILDDLCDTGETIIRAAEACQHAGAAAVHAAVTHTPSSSGFEAVVQSEYVNTLVATNSVGFAVTTGSPIASGKAVILSCAPLFGEALRRIHAKEPLTPLLTRWPVTPATDCEQ